MTDLPSLTLREVANLAGIPESVTDEMLIKYTDLIHREDERKQLLGLRKQNQLNYLEVLNQQKQLRSNVDAAHSMISRIASELHKHNIKVDLKKPHKLKD